MKLRALLVIVGLGLLVALTSQFWIPFLGLALVDTDPLAPADAVLVVDGSGVRSMDVAEEWRQQGIVQTVVIVEAPLETHALVTYWTDLVRAGLARPSPTPPEFLRVVRSDQSGPAAQARAALPALQQVNARSVIAMGGGLGSRLTRREIGGVLQPQGISLRVVAPGPPPHDPARWYAYADDRRRVLGLWLQLLIPFLGSS